MMDEPEFIFQQAQEDPIAVATQCLVALAESIDTTQSYTARRELIEMMRNIVKIMTPPRGQLTVLPGGSLFDPTIN